jgi:flavorubredoxin
VIDTRCDEIADGIYRISTYLGEGAQPVGFTVNQFLVLAEEPLLFHTGHRAQWPAIAAAIGRVMPIDRLRWISFGHVEGDECGATNELLRAAPRATVAFGLLGCQLSLRDLCDRPPRPVADGETLDLGGRRVRFLTTPHVPHNWEAQVLYEETTGTLLCGDLFTQAGPCRALDDDIVARTIDTEQTLCSTPRGRAVPTTLRRLARLEPRALAVMHGSSYSGDGGAALRDLATAWEQRLGCGDNAATGR